MVHNMGRSPQLFTRSYKHHSLDGDHTGYNSVDAVGDIDLVFLSELDQNSLARLLYQTVPFSDCRSWDFQTAAFAKEAAIRNGLLSADRLVLWFDGLEEPCLAGHGRTTFASLLAAIAASSRAKCRPRPLVM
jgi:hypothetical protein